MAAATAAQSRYTEEDAEAVELYLLQLARDNFWCYRQLINPNMLVGWWQESVAAELQDFYQRWRNGERPKLVLQSPPQHGKSKQVVDFISYVSGKHPDAQTIYASYSDRLATRANLNLQRIIDGPAFRKLFPGTALAEMGAQRYGLRYLRNLELLEFVGRTGSFRNTTVLGGVTGEGLNLGVVDDPIKGRAEASSQLIRDKTWGWFTDDFFTRFSDDAALLMILTRWHVDDPVGRLKAEFGDNVKLLRYPALAEEDEAYRDQGEPLFPELKSKDFLLERKRLLTLAGWESIYQQNPIIVGGGFFPVDQFRFVAQQPAPNQVKTSVRYWDKAGTEEGGAYTAGVLVEETHEGYFVVSDVQRGQWGARERENRIRQTAVMDTRDRRVKTWVEREPGSGGKESAEHTIRTTLKGFVAEWDLVTGTKEARAEPFAAQVQGGNVALVQADWNRDYLNEYEMFPNGKYKDQVDAGSGAFNKLVVGGPGYLSEGTVKGLY
jgi:predicted phage terminase large subunit-like protein